MTAMKGSSMVPPAVSPDALHRLADAELSLASRLGYVALLLASLAMTAVVTALWLTEPALPVRAQIGFAVMIPIGLSWAAFASWVLTRRRVLFARHSIIAGRMSVTFTTVFVVGAAILGFTTGGAGPFAAAAVGLLMLAAAVVILRRAHANFARLSERRKALEDQLGRSGR
jgi:hypothetical protein